MRHFDEGGVLFQDDDPLVNDKHDNDQFEPSPRILIRILRLLIEKNAVGRTRLAQAANVHYALLLKHLKWLEHKQYIKFVLEDGRAVVRLTQSGRDFAMNLLGFFK